jgi:hypothetical protein
MNQQIAKTNIESKVSVRLPKILTEAENLFSEKNRSNTSRSINTKSIQASKLIGLDSTSRSKLLTSRSVNDKVTAKSTSRFLVVP